MDMLPVMYAKLFSRIAQSSLMEQDVETRYCFMMLLAIADAGGDVIGTDVALARAINLPLETFKRCVASLMSPDPDSNSQVHDGRRIVSSENGRGYLLVNYVTYRTIKTAEEKKSYMREYMKRYRKSKNPNDVDDVNNCKTPLIELEHAEGELDSDGKEEKKQKASERGLKFADWFKTILPPKINLSGNWRENWAKCFDDMLRLDKRTPEEIQKVCQWARSDDFWGSNFMSPMKLRERKDAVQYFDTFAAKMASASANGHKPAPKRPLQDEDPAGWREFLKAKGRSQEPFERAMQVLKEEFRDKQAVQ